MLAFESQFRLPWNADGSLTLTSVRPNSTNETATVGVFAAYPGMVREAKPSNAVFQTQDCTFTFGLDAVSFPPKSRDTVAWDYADPSFVWQSDTFKIKTAQRFDFLKYWRLECFRLVAHVDLADSIAVWRPSVTTSSDGLRSRTLSVVSGASAIAGRLQPDSWREEQDTDGRILRRQTYTAYLSTAIVLQLGDVLRVGGIDHEVTGQSEIDQYDTYTTAQCTRIA
jgi:hypothetical protein